MDQSNDYLLTMYKILDTELSELKTILCRNKKRFRSIGTQKELIISEFSDTKTV